MVQKLIQEEVKELFNNIVQVNDRKESQMVECHESQTKRIVSKNLY